MRDSFQNQIEVVKEELFYDGLHPNGNGYRVWADNMNALFQQLLSSPNP